MGAVAPMEGPGRRQSRSCEGRPLPRARGRLSGPLTECLGNLSVGAPISSARTSSVASARGTYLAPLGASIWEGGRRRRGRAQPAPAKPPVRAPTTLFG